MSDVAQGLAIGGGALAAAILDVLVRKNILTSVEARGVIDDAARQIRSHTASPGGSEAADFLVALGRQHAERN